VKDWIQIPVREGSRISKDSLAQCSVCKKKGEPESQDLYRLNWIFGTLKRKPGET
jgi:hypothetical protein